MTQSRARSSLVIGLWSFVGHWGPLAVGTWSLVIYHLSMQYRRFANTRIDVSEVGLGCWQLGGADWGDVSDEKALEILRASVERGVTLLDTADVYGAGRSEALIGRFLKEEKPKNLFVATKLGRFP